MTAPVPGNLGHEANEGRGGMTAEDDGDGPETQQLPPEASEFHHHHAILAALSGHPQDRPQVEVIVGPPGVGKSALAAHWANLVGDRFKDGRIYLDLRGAGQGRPLTDPEAFSALFTSLEYDPAALPADPERLAALWRTATHERSLLVLLDNAADARQVVRLLPNGPRTTTLITSRNALTELSALSGVRTTRLTLLEPDDAVSLLRRLIEPTRGPVDHHELAELGARRRRGEAELAHHGLDGLDGAR